MQIGAFLFVSLSVTILIILDLGRLNDMVIREVTWCDYPQAAYNTEEMIGLTLVIIFLSYFDAIRC